MGAEMSPGIEKLSGPMSSLSLVYPMSKEQGSCLPVTPVWIVGRMCNFLHSFLMQQRFEWVDQCYSLVTAQSFIWQTNHSTPLRHEDRPTPEERPQPTLAPSFYTFCFLSPEPALYKLGLASKGACLFHLRFLLRSKDFSFVPFLCAFPIIFSAQFSSVTQSCLTLCNPMDCSTPGFPIHHQLLELTQAHVHQVSDAIQQSHPVVPISPHL